jgi:pilus assembly protein Flp/PilA
VLFYLRGASYACERSRILHVKLEKLKKRGQGLVEYALILVLIAIVVIVILSFLGQQVNSTFSKIGSALAP